MVLCKIKLPIFIVRQKDLCLSLSVLLLVFFFFLSCDVVILQVLTEKAKSVAGVQQWPYKAVAKALEVIPRTLIQNCGANTIRTLTALRVSIHVSYQLGRIPVRVFIKGCHAKLLKIRFLSSTCGKLLNFS